MQLKLSDTDIKKVLAQHLEIVVDRREKEWSHIKAAFDEKGVRYKDGTNDTGDFTVEILPNEIIGNTRPLFIPSSVERKGSLSELIGNLKEDRFENELIRSRSLDSFVILVENAKYEDIVEGNYRSEYKPQSAIGRLKSFELKYKFSLNFIGKETSATWIYHHLHYSARHALRNTSL